VRQLRAPADAGLLHRGRIAGGEPPPERRGLRRAGRLQVPCGWSATVPVPVCRPPRARRKSLLFPARRLGRAAGLPRGYVIDQGTVAGLLLVPELARAGVVRYQLWQPGTGRVSRSFPNVIAASPGEIAWMSACTVRCAVHVLNLDGGPGRVIPLPRRSQAYQGAFSPDGRLLALQVTARIGAGGRAAATWLVVAAVGSGRLTAVPGATIGAGIGIDFGWQPAGRRLVAAAALQDGWQVAVWCPGDGRLYPAVTRAPAGSWPAVGPGPY